MIRNLGRSGSLFVTALLAITILSSTAAPAWADDGGDNTASKGGDSCWLNADTGETRCFGSDQARMAAVTGPVGFAARAVFPLAYLYESPSWGGASLFVSSSSATFCATGSVNQTTIQAGWDNRISSVSLFNGCTARLYDLTNLLSPLGTFGSAASLGAADNRTTSYQIT